MLHQDALVFTIRHTIIPIFTQGKLIYQLIGRSFFFLEVIGQLFHHLFLTSGKLRFWPRYHSFVFCELKCSFFAPLEANHNIWIIYDGKVLAMNHIIV